MPTRSDVNSATPINLDNVPTTTTRRRNWLSRELRFFSKNKELFILSLPGIIFILIMSYFPMVGVIVAFKDYLDNKGLFGSPWVGFQNFTFFFQSNDALRITRNTVLYNAAFIVIGTVASLALALLLNEISRFRKIISVYQTAMFLPFFVSWIIVSYIVYGFLNDQNGYVNHIIQHMGMQPVSWYESPQYWPFILIIANLWKGVGFSTLVYFAGIMGIDSSYYDAAKIDGASRWQIATRITLPLLTPLITILLILAVGGIFHADFGLFFFVPNNSSFLYPTTDVIDTYVFRALRQLGDIGMSAAVGLYQSAVGFILVLLTNYVVKKINSDNSLW